MVLKDATQLLCIELACDRTAAASAREAVAGLTDLGWIGGDARLIASELVTNVITHVGCHAQGRIELEVTDSGTAIGISVRDRDTQAPPVHARPRSLVPSHGLGLMILAALARAWGTDHDGGYRAWAELGKSPKH